MKISINQYATTLYELTQYKSKLEIDSVVKKFVELLVKNNDLKIADKIVEKFNEIYNREHGIIEAEITSREELRSEVHTKVRNYVSNKYKAKEVVINNKVDENIKGGILIKVGDEIVDASVAGKLNDLKNILTK